MFCSHSQTSFITVTMIMVMSQYIISHEEAKSLRFKSRCCQHSHAPLLILAWRMSPKRVSSTTPLLFPHLKSSSHNKPNTQLRQRRLHLHLTSSFLSVPHLSIFSRLEPSPCLTPTVPFHFLFKDGVTHPKTKVRYQRQEKKAENKPCRQHLRSMLISLGWRGGQP
jgi:hypothetical protein